MKIILLILFFIGIIVTILGYYESKNNEQKKVEYKFIDKSIEEWYKDNSKGAYDIFKPMFTNNSILS